MLIHSPPFLTGSVFSALVLCEAPPQAVEKRVLGSQTPYLAMARMEELLGTAAGNSKARGLRLVSDACLSPVGIWSPTSP